MSDAPLADRLERIEAALRDLDARIDALENTRGAAPDAAFGARVDVAPALETKLAEAPAVAATPSRTPVAAEVPRKDPGAAPSLRAALARPRNTPPPDTRESVAAAHESRAAVAPPEPAAQFDDSWVDWLLGGNIVAKIGVLVLFCGVGFLLKYAYDYGMLPVPLRLAGVAAAGLGMLYAGWRLLDKRRLYGLILQGGGIGLLYLDMFFALRVYHLASEMAGFGAFMALGVAATLLAVRQDAKVLAVLGSTGAFLAPVLAGSQTGSHVLLFSYYALLNAFILAISWFKAWRDLNLVGFVFTFVIGILWGSGNYRPEYFASVEPFVLLFFTMYLVIPILFAQRQPPELKGLIDGTLVFGTPLCAAFMQAALVKDMPYGLAWSAAIASALYALLAIATIRRDGMRLLGEAYVALAAVFLTLAILFAFDAYPTFALWTLEGAAIYWIGLRQRRVLARCFGLALQLAGTVYFVASYSTYALTNPWWNAFVAGCAIIAAAGFIVAWLAHNHRDVINGSAEPGESMMLVWGAFWWTLAGVHALDHAYAGPAFASALLAFAALSAGAVELIGTRLHWRGLRRLAALLPAGMSLVLLLQVSHEVHPFAAYGWLAWPLAVALLYFVLRRQEEGRVALFTPAQHVLGLWIALIAMTWEAVRQLQTAGFGTAWLTGAWGLVPAAAMVYVSGFAARAVWPFGVHYRTIYRTAALGPVAAYLALWLLYANFGAPGSMKPLPYVPILNPLDIANLTVFVALLRWSRTYAKSELPGRTSAPVVAAFGFLWVNCVLLRTIHYWAGVAYDWDTLARSVLVQSGFSLLWTATALIVMRYAVRGGRRHLWMAGAALLGLVVLKLFVNDLSNTGTVARIVTFIGVGAGLLVIGYVAPVPPGDTERQAD